MAPGPLPDASALNTPGALETTAKVRELDRTLPKIDSTEALEAPATSYGTIALICPAPGPLPDASALTTPGALETTAKVRELDRTLPKIDSTEALEAPATSYGTIALICPAPADRKSVM